MARQLVIMLIVVTLAACGKQQEIHDAALAEGDWGWQDGKGCKGLKDVWRVEGEVMTVFTDGEVTEKRRISSRELEFSNRYSDPNKNGRLEGTVWVTGRIDKETGETVWLREYFSVSYTSVQGFKALIYGHGRESRGGDFRKVDTGRRRGERLKPCAMAG